MIWKFVDIMIDYIENLRYWNWFSSLYIFILTTNYRRSIDNSRAKLRQSSSLSTRRLNVSRGKSQRIPISATFLRIWFYVSTDCKLHTEGNSRNGHEVWLAVPFNRNYYVDHHLLRPRALTYLATIEIQSGELNTYERKTSLAFIDI